MHGKGEIMGRFVKKIKNKQYGQAMAEFALTLPIFLLLVFGIIELSRFFLVYSSVFTASREASRYGSAAGTTTRIIDEKEEKFFQFEDCYGIKETAVRMGNFGGVQDNDVTIYYESTPGNIVASCPNNNPETVPIEEVCVSDGCVYSPELGDRVLVDIVTEFDSLLGIVPDLPVRAANGRTIMMEISIEKEPPIIDICDEHVKILGEPNQDGENILYIEVENTSLTTQYLIYKIENIQWEFLNEVEEEPKLEEIRWIDDDRPIWIKPDDPNIPNDEEPGALPVLTIPEGNIVEYWKEFTRNLPPNTESEKLEFIFDGPVSNEGEEINLTFQLIMQHGSIPSDLCNPVLIKE